MRNPAPPEVPTARSWRIGSTARAEDSQVLLVVEADRQPVSPHTELAFVAPRRPSEKRPSISPTRPLLPSGVRSPTADRAPDAAASRRWRTGGVGKRLGSSRLLGAVLGGSCSASFGSRPETAQAEPNHFLRNRLDHVKAMARRPRGCGWTASSAGLRDTVLGGGCSACIGWRSKTARADQGRVKYGRWRRPDASVAPLWTSRSQGLFP